VPTIRLLVVTTLEMRTPDMEVFVKWGEGGKRRRGQEAATVILSLIHI